MTEPPPEGERQRLFVQMRWVYVYLPPILLVMTAGVAAFIIALATAELGFTFGKRLGSSVLLMAALALAMFGIHRRSNR